MTCLRLAFGHRQLQPFDAYEAFSDGSFAQLDGLNRPGETAASRPLLETLRGCELGLIGDVSEYMPKRLMASLYTALAAVDKPAAAIASNTFGVPFLANGAAVRSLRVPPVFTSHRDRSSLSCPSWQGVPIVLR
jgi:hypothetical protein